MIQTNSSTMSAITANKVGTGTIGSGSVSAAPSANSNNTRPEGVGISPTTEPENNNTNPSGVCFVNQLSVHPVDKAGTGKSAQTYSGVGTSAASASTMAEAKDGT